MQKILASQILLTIGVTVYLIVIPSLEINTSHVFNTDWPMHARFHEVWQLASNVMIGIYVLWLVWKKQNIEIAVTLNAMVMGGVLFAHFTESLYGGSVQSGNIAKHVMGLDLAVFVALFVVLTSLLAGVLSKQKTMH